jgi:hypothetical protein
MSQPAIAASAPMPFLRRAFDWWLAQVKHALPPTILYEIRTYFVRHHPNVSTVINSRPADVVGHVMLPRKSPHTMPITIVTKHGRAAAGEQLVLSSARGYFCLADPFWPRQTTLSFPYRACRVCCR